MKRFNIMISTDGACSGNPGPGGWAAVLRMGDYVKEISGYAEKTTNNCMELTALIKAVEGLKGPCCITVRTDSQFVCNGIANAKEREANGWHTKTGARCAHYQLWTKLAELKNAGDHRIGFQHITAHSGDEDNERCDKLAKQAIKDKHGIGEGEKNA